MWNVKHNRRVRKKYGQRIHTDLGGDESAGHRLSQRRGEKTAAAAAYLRGE
jgi:hypothetical protein